ncbi:hypothetical protein ACFQ9Z_34810 [Streptomyces sp. NPDC056580]|uniref:hypothetical protein n=1 Tax=Streptomyces sp. NPDC056580 TaxID=3345872 RepID=UPI003698F2B8
MTDVPYLPGKHIVTDEQLVDWEVDRVEDIVAAVAGPCPGCGHPTRQKVEQTALATGQSGAAGRALPKKDRLTVVCECACDLSHTDGAEPPSHWQSCGRWWLVTIRLSPDSDGQPVCAALDDSMLEAAQAARKAMANDETHIRSASEKWIAAITALIGLFGLAGLVAGKNSFSGLPNTALYTVAGAGCMAVLAAAGAIILANRAAYGWPTVVDISNDEALERWYVNQRTIVEKAAQRLRTAVRLSLLSLVSLMVIVGCNVLWPRGLAVQVTRVGGGGVCGTLINTATPAQLRIKRPNGDVTTVSAADIKSLVVAPGCS